MNNQETSLRDHATGLSLGTVYVAWLVATARTLGFARDEGFYFRAASDYARWFALFFEKPAQAIDRSTVDAIWSSNHEHPAFVKSLFALSKLYLFDKWHLFSDMSTAFRFPAMVLSGMAIYVTYLFGARAYSRTAGFIAAVLLGLVPSVFYNAHLACFDAPILAMWTLTLYVYWRSVKERSIGFSLLLGVIYGLTLNTKHNAWILPFVIVPHALLVHRRAAGRALRLGMVPLPANLLAMFTIGPLVFFATWPWIWNDTFPRIQAYMAFHLNHEYYNMEFLGRNYFSAPSPRAYMPVMIAATVPTVTLALFFVGAFERVTTEVKRWLSFVHWQKPADPDPLHTDLLFTLAFFAAIGPWLFPKTPIFGGTKHWLTAYPFLCLFAGRGFDLVCTAAKGTPPIRSVFVARVVPLALGLCVLLGPFLITTHSHPFGLSTYVPFAGGVRGGATLGLNRQFWGYTTQSANVEYMEKHAPNGSRVFIHDTAWDSWERMRDETRVRPDLQAVGSPSEADIALVQHELHMAEVDYQIWTAFGTTSPTYVVAHDDVPIVSVYRR